MSQVFPRLTHTNLLCFLLSAAHVRSASILRICRHKDGGCTSAATPQLHCSRHKGGSSPAPNPPQLPKALHEDVHGASSGAHQAGHSADCRAAQILPWKMLPGAQRCWLYGVRAFCPPSILPSSSNAKKPHFRVQFQFKQML